MIKWLSLLLLFNTLLPLGTAAQVLYPDSELLNYFRVLEIKNPDMNNRMNSFPSIIDQMNKDTLIWNIWSEHIKFQRVENNSIEVLPLRITNHINSTYARGYNDGALWKGKGYTGSFQGGFKGNFGPIKFTFAPLIYYSQNLDFELAAQRNNNTPYNYQLRNQNIDFVQKFGDKSFTSVNMGQSELRLVLKSMALGFSTQNITWGPAQRNPILLSNNASGIPHIHLGTNEPIETKIGRIEGKIYYGTLKKSDYFDDSSKFNHRYWSGLTLAYNPSFLPSLYLGFNRSFYKSRQDFVPLDLLVFFWKFDDHDSSEPGNDEYDQLASVTLRWLYQEVGFEAYFEYGINDYGAKLYGTEPEHGRGYVLGFSKYIDIKNLNILKLTYEHASVDRPKNLTYRFNNSWYSHSIVKQGYTIDGQLLGAGIGPGSISDYFDLQYFFRSGRLQLTAQRIRFDDDYFYLNINDLYNRDHEWTLESKFSRFFGQYLIGIDLAVSFRQNQYFVESNDKRNVLLGLNITRNFN